MRRLLALACLLSAATIAGRARAESAPAAGAGAEVTLGGASSAASTVAPAAPAPTPDTTLPEAPPEAPPPLPRHKGLVLGGSLGVLSFLGQFRHVAPTGMWLHTQLGYELFDWLMLFGEGELAFTDTSESQSELKARAFPIFGFGGGARVTIHFTPRVAMFLQGGVGAMKADIATNGLGTLGFKSAESLGVYFGGRIGVEWYQIDRHFALALEGGVRDATGFKKSIGADTPLMWDAGPAIRYTF